MMTEEECREVVDLYQNKRWTIYRIARRFHVTSGYVWQIVNGKKKGVLGLTNEQLRRKHFERYYIIKDDVLWKVCKCCNRELLVNQINFYFSDEGLVKYSTCKTCHKKKVVQARKIRREKKRASQIKSTSEVHVERREPNDQKTGS